VSEFSESYHLESRSQDDGVDLLRRAGLRGFVFPPGNGWVSIVPVDARYGEPNEALVKACEGMLLHYANAEDDGWMFTVYREGSPVCRYGCRWGGDLEAFEDEVEVDDERFDAGLALRLAAGHGTDPDEAREVLAELLYPQSQEWLQEYLEENNLQNPGHTFAHLIGLQHYSWIAPESFESGHEILKAVEGIVTVE
jgi:hypothetical protein